MKTREYERARSARRRATNGAHINAHARKRHAERMATDPAYRAAKAANALNWVKAHPDKATANVMRRDAGKLRATPIWADRAGIDAFYELSARCRLAGEICEVDHIVPLRSPRVCGLHVPENLMVIESVENKSKGNRHWPDQW